MENHILKSKAIKSFFWKMFERVSVQGAQLVVQIVLARILLPEDFGLIAIVLTVVAISNVFVQRGFSNALIQKNKVSRKDFDSAFIISLVVSFILYILIFFIAPIISQMFDYPNMTIVIRVLSVSIIIGALNQIQYAYIARNFLFHKLFISSIIAVPISGFIGIYVAINGGGVWALVTQQLLNQLLTSIVLLISVKWKPRMSFSLTSVTSLINYGWKLLVASLVDTIYNEVSSFIIGTKYNLEVLGYYSKGKQFPNLITTNLDGSIQTVLFPTLSVKQDDSHSIKVIMSRAISLSTYLIFPIMIFLISSSNNFVIVILTEKWLSSVPYLIIFSVMFSIYTIHSINLQAINSIGRSDIYLKLELLKKLLGFSILISTIFFGPLYIALGLMVNSILGFFINSFLSKKYFDFGSFKQIKLFFPNLLLACFVGIFVYCIGLVNQNIYQTLILQWSVGFILYIAFSYVSKNPSFLYLFNILKSGIQKL